MQMARNAIRYEERIVGRLIKMLALKEDIVSVFFFFFFTRTARGIQED